MYCSSMSYGSVTLVKVVFAQAMKGQDIVFLYLANNSPDVSWKNTIKKYKLLGEQVVHYNLLTKQLSFYFPMQRCWQMRSGLFHPKLVW